MKNKNQPAFPVTVQYNVNGDPIGYQNGSSTGQEIGITKLEFFACNAPCDIPSWFEHVPPENNVTPQPTWHTLPKDAQEHIKMWFSENIELPEDLKWFSDQYIKFEKEGTAYKKSDWAARYFQWRKFYAENLLAELSKS